MWDAWNNREPEQQAHDGVEANDRFVARLEDLSDETLGAPIKVFGMDLLIGDLARDYASASTPCTAGTSQSRSTPPRSSLPTQSPC